MKNLNLKVRIFKKFRTQCDFTSEMEMREERISRIIHGRTTPTKKEKQKIAMTLGFKIVDLFPEA